MENRDIIMDQLQQLGKVLGEILAQILGSKSGSNTSTLLKEAEESLSTNFQIDFVQIIKLNKEDLKTHLEKIKFPTAHYEKLGTIAQEMGLIKRRTDEDLAKKYLATAINLYDLEDEQSQTVSFTRMNQKTKLQQLIHSEG